MRTCREAVDYGFASVCVNPYYVPLVADMVRGSRVLTCTVVGFPLGANMPETKAFETRRAVQDGAQEIDMVINIGALKSARFDWVRHDIQQVVEASHGGGAIVKVIFETALLTDEEKIIACEISRDAGAEYVKTSTWLRSRWRDHRRRRLDVLRSRQENGRQSGGWHRRPPGRGSDDRRGRHPNRRQRRRQDHPRTLVCRPQNSLTLVASGDGASPRRGDDGDVCTSSRSHDKGIAPSRPYPAGRGQVSSYSGDGTLTIVATLELETTCLTRSTASITRKTVRPSPATCHSAAN